MNERNSFFLTHHIAVGVVFLNKGVVYTYIQSIVCWGEKGTPVLLVSKFFCTVKSSSLKRVKLKFLQIKIVWLFFCCLVR